MRVLGIDPSMRNLGWHLRDFDEEFLTLSKSKKISGGTIKNEDSKEFFLTRLLTTSNALHDKVNEYKPDIVGIESQIMFGMNRSSILPVIFSLSIEFWHPSRIELTKKLDYHIPKYVVLFSPERVQSLAHNQRKTPGSEVVKKYKELTKDTIRVTEHEADAMFIGLYAWRFINACVLNKISRVSLSKNEVSIFLEAVDKKGEKKDILSNKGTMWWVNN